MDEIDVANKEPTVIPDSAPIANRGYVPMQADYKPANSPILDLGKVGDSEMAIDMREGSGALTPRTLLYKEC